MGEMVAGLNGSPDFHMQVDPIGEMIAAFELQGIDVVHHLQLRSEVVHGEKCHAERSWFGVLEASYKDIEQGVFHVRPLRDGHANRMIEGKLFFRGRHG
jgi:hypothetical protein